MNDSPIWVILGATSIIAEKFAHIVAAKGLPLLLVGRHRQQLELIQADIGIRYKSACEFYIWDSSESSEIFISYLEKLNRPISLLIAYSAQVNNSELTTQTIQSLVQVNITSVVQISHYYLNKPQASHQLIFLSSVAGCRGRAKNSLYGASKKAIETYLTGYQQHASITQTITIMTLGFIDTHQTYGVTPFAASPKACAKKCWQALNRGKRHVFYPFFWRYIMKLIAWLPFVIYRKLKF
ncbi:MAG TPA: short-chain dehydrogenase [Legionellales bacterium]|nr:short-chain dehydrogenase [Legionellales bacterium]HCA90094.1 short-chain dehydrogenase [Legionellales bacterium]|tara:strand:+ start:195 stop:911 length:717 start_codon:yes stop_codon:yes gene_type:complete